MSGGGKHYGDKTMAVQHEEEGLYHRREYERTTKPVITYEKYQVPAAAKKSSSSSRQLAAASSGGRHHDTSDDDDNFEEWTTSKRKVNHKTRQVETRVSRQLLVEDGKVIADSGPQVTTRIKEDNKVEECEKEKQPKNRAKFEALEGAPECGPDGAAPGGGRVLGEKKEIQRVSREIREENMQYHDERFKELTGHDVHRRAIQAPHELITINDELDEGGGGGGKRTGHNQAPRGKMVHYSNKGKKYQDTDEILEVAKLAIDGSITKEVKRTKHHEEFSEDEKPDEKGEAEALRHEPIVTRSSRRHVDYVNDFDDTATPSCSSDDDDEQLDHQQRKTHHKLHHQHHHNNNQKSGRKHQHHHQHHQRDDPAFPRYEIDPLLNSLRDEDFKPVAVGSSAGGRPTQVREHSLERKASRHRAGSDSSDGEYRHRARHGRPVSPATAGRLLAASRSSASPTTGAAVEIPEEYRANRQRLLTGKGRGATGGGGGQQRERSFSPQQSKLLLSSSSASPRGHKHHKEDASVQARLTDEEVERRSVKSATSSAASSVANHEKTARHLQRQSTANSSRNYYYGDRKHQRNTQRAPLSRSSSSSSLSSLSDPKERMRQQGTRSRDSGFKSPHHHKHRGGEATPIEASEHANSQQIYSVSSKAAAKNRRRDDQDEQAHHKHHHHQRVSSPTPTAASQRSVKTTTTIMSAGLADRPASRQVRSVTPTTTNSNKSKRTGGSDHKNANSSKSRDYHGTNEESATNNNNDNNWDEQQQQQQRRAQFDTVSLSSLQGPNATTIKVPYKRTIEVERTGGTNNNENSNHNNDNNTRNYPASRDTGPPVSGTASEMSFQEDIQSLSKRLESIRRLGAEGPSQNNNNNNNNNNKQQFDYKTIIRNIQPASQVVPRQNQVIGAYNLRVIEHNSPFREHGNSTLIDDKLGHQGNNSQQQQQQGNQVLINVTENNNSYTNLDDYIKYRAVPVLVDSGIGGDSSSNNMDLDRMSLASSCSLQSSKTYKIRTIASNNSNNPNESYNGPALEPQQQADKGEQSEQQVTPNGDADDGDDETNEIEFDENGNSKRPQAWVFDPRDGSSTAIAPPVRPKRPETPQVDAKTEELVQSRGGRSYYLELRDPSDKPRKQGDHRRPSSIDSLYSRWNSHGALNGFAADQGGRHNSRQAIGASKASNLDVNNSQVNNSGGGGQKPNNSFKPFTFKKLPPSTTKNGNSNNNNTNPATRRQLPFGGPAPNIGSRSRSSSCLLTVTKPSKYSIYGGFRKPGENNKPVPRLSYSRAIGPKSQRQIDAQPKVPSRYLKMK